MPAVTHIVITGNFAGVERHVADVARETAARGWVVTVVGGQPERMRRELGPRVRWRPGGTAATALASLAGLGRQDICHAHMTLAEAVAVAARPLHRAPIVSTRHFAAPRGASRAGRVLVPRLASRITREVAVSNYVASRVERLPDAIIPNGVRPSPLLWKPESRVVLLVQRLEPEKDTRTALRAWQLSGLAEEGWSLRIAGDGAERRALEGWVSERSVPGVVFAGWQEDVAAELAGAGMFFTAAPAEPFGLAVLEAMAAGVPVVASAAGGHLETAGSVPGGRLFPPGDAEAAAATLRTFLSAGARASASAAGRAVVERSLTIDVHVDRLFREYALVSRSGANDDGAGRIRTSLTGLR